MIAVIMAGGKGTRIASVDGTVPKPLLPVAGKPVLEREIDCLREQGITEIVLTVGHMAEKICDYFGDGSRFGVRIRYIREQTPLGTAGALYALKGKVGGDFLLLNGDMVFDVDVHRMLDFHRARGAAATLLVHPNDHPYDSGLIVAEEDGRVGRWLTKEEPRGWCANCVNAGIHILSPEMLDMLTEPRKTDLDRDMLRPSIPGGRVYAYRSPEYVKDMGTPERIRQVERDIESGLVQRRNLSRRQRAVFLDRDGTINRYVGFLRRADQFELLPGVAGAIRRINRSGYLAVVVTNQPVIARGETTWEELGEIHRKMETLLGEQGAYVDDIFVCPHHPDRGFPGERPEYKLDCGCRKPKPGLLLQAAKKYNIDLSGSWMIGDSDADVEAGRAAGCRTVRLDAAKTLADAVGEALEGGRALKIVIVGPVYPYRGGIAQYTGLMAQSLARTHEVVSVSFSLQYPKCLYKNEQKDYANDTFKAPDARYLINTVNPFTWVSAARRINALEPDMVIFQWWHPFFAPAYWCIRTLLNKRIPTVYCCHNVLPHEGFPCKRLLTKMAIGKGRGFIVHSGQDEADLRALVPNPNVKRSVHPTYNAFRLRGMSREEARKQLGFSPDREILLFFGFIRKYKGLRHLLAAMPRILKERPRAHLLVVGEFFDGDKQDYLDLIAKCGIPDGALTLVDGYVPDRAVEPYFAACDVVALPYESATQSGVVQIAYGFERPVIVTAVGGLPDVVTDGETGFVVPPQDEEALAQAAIRFFAEGRAQAFREGIQREAYRYSWDRMNETVERLAGEM